MHCAFGLWEEAGVPGENPYSHIFIHTVKDFVSFSISIERKGRLYYSTGHTVGIHFSNVYMSSKFIMQT